MKNAQEEAFYRLVGARIRSLRGKLSQEQLAKAIHMTRTSVVNIETGQQKLLVHNLFRIAEALNIKPSDIIGPLEPTGDEMWPVPVSEHVHPDVNQWITRGVAKALERSTS